MTPDALRAGRAAMVFWTVSHVLILAVILGHDSPLRHALAERDIVYGALFFSLFLANTVCYVGCCYMDPGYVPRDEARRCGNPSTAQRPRDDGAMYEDDLELEPVVSQEGDALVGEEEAATVTMPPPRMCRACHIIQPLRTRHCHECERCIAKFDHHCFWIGQCVGARNHCIFWWFLFFQTVLIGWALQITVSSFGNSSAETWFGDNILLLCATVFMAIFSFIPMGLLVYHTFLVLTSQTTWEAVRHEHIDYLKDFPENASPFNRGVVKNVIAFCCCRGEETWTLPKTVPVPAETICDNRYYSCW